MASRVSTVIIGGLLLAGGAWLGARGWGRLPPLGPLLDPANGIWATARAAAPVTGRLSLPGLGAAVDVVVDRRGVPHIYGASEADVYRALGYLVARDRLFQLELQSRAAAGRLTEWIGPAGLASDRRARRLGFPRLVERTLALADTSAPGFRSIVAYADGVNAWIDGMAKARLPIEYRLLRRAPARWTVENTYYLLGRMALTLALNDPSLVKARVAGQVGWEAADALFPIEAPVQEPIQPNPKDEPRLAARAIPPPGPGDPALAAAAGALEELGQRLGLSPHPANPVELGSNNWAVAPPRTRDGYALLAGDPHLELSLPSIWYQAHLVVPGRLDVQGVTLPGAPWVIIGFNRDIAWSFTNTGADVHDYYRETVDDPINPGRYLLDGEWRDLETRIEVMRGPRGDTLAVDTVRFTHRGPLEQAGALWLSMAWSIYRGASSSESFVQAGRARTAGEFLEAMRHYEAPAQNMLVADRRGTIAIRSTGWFPVRPAAGRGDLILDGSRSSADWRGPMPVEFHPFSINPGRGFLSSANQQPVDPAINPRYFGADWPAPWRALRINALLRADSGVTVDAMRRWQADHTSARAQAFLRVLLDEGVAASPAAEEAQALLRGWDGRYARNETRPILFERIMRELRSLVWDELDAPGEAEEARLAGPRPNDAVLLRLLEDPGNLWWDLQRTSDRVETRDEVLALALAGGLAATRAEFGPETGPSWEWGAVHRANIRHLLGLDAWSALDLAVDAGPSTLNPSSGRGTAGASWRMVVELGPDVRAWAVLPGGQSGNPASRHYRDQIVAWQRGTLDSLVHPARPDAFPEAAVESRLRLTPR